jgi:hypothetical protein
MNNAASEPTTVSWRCAIIFLAFNCAIPILGKRSNHLFPPGGPNSPDLKPKNGHRRVPLPPRSLFLFL